MSREQKWPDVLWLARHGQSAANVTRDYRRERVLIVAHSVVVLCFRYLFERMTEEQILAIDHTDDVANCAITEYVYNEQVGRHGRLALRRYNFVAPLEAEG